ncbi:MAG: hypothetical protein A2Y38_07685 [Spirochaetes bacterium GWB1_59_5]|nr:MAG: hypothetical protein A2Y38_07685 [Spirochaetes bacterium GWB1_59_5]
MLNMYSDFLLKLRQLDHVRLQSVLTREVPDLKSLAEEELEWFLQWAECSSQLRAILPIANEALDGILSIQGAIPRLRTGVEVTEL